MKRIALFSSVLVAALSSTTAMAAEPAADQFLAMSQISGDVASMSEDQLSTIEGAGGHGGALEVINGSQTGDGILNVNLLNGNSIQLLSGNGIFGSGSATSIVGSIVQ